MKSPLLDPLVVRHRALVERFLFADRSLMFTPQEEGDEQDGGDDDHRSQLLATDEVEVGPRERVVVDVVRLGVVGEDRLFLLLIAGEALDQRHFATAAVVVLRRVEHVLD